jgi:predicted nucleotidyltransferase
MQYTIEDIKKIVAPIAEKYRLKSVDLFGSYAKYEAKDGSDIDLYIDYTGTSLKGLEYGKVYADINAAFNCSVDIIENGVFLSPSNLALSGYLKKEIENSRERIYG